jgi:hypothetical protein
MLWMCNVSYDMMLEYYKNGIADPVDPPGDDDDDDDDDIHAGGAGGANEEPAEQQGDGWM